MKRRPITPNSQIKNVLRKMWLQSRERAAALKRDLYTCQLCGVKQSKAKGKEVILNVHHKDGIDWDGIFDLIRSRLLQDQSKLITLCKKCHDMTEEKEVIK